MNVVTYIIRWGMGRGGVVDRTRIAGSLRDCDIICLQEAERHWRKMNHADQVDRMAELLADHHFTFAPSVNVNDPIHREGSKAAIRVVDPVALADPVRTDFPPAETPAHRPSGHQPVFAQISIP